MKHQFNLTDNQYISIEKNMNGKDIFLYDNLNHNRRLLAHNLNGRWTELSYDFFILAKKFPSCFMNNIHHSLEEFLPVPEQAGRRWRKIKIFFKRILK